MITTLHASARQDVERALGRAGFRLHPGDGTYRRNVHDAAYVARWERGWLTIETGLRPDSDPTGEVDLAEAGLWRSLRDDAGSTRRVFDLPAIAWMVETGDGDYGDHADHEAGSVLDSCIRWAIDSDRRTSLDEWTPPSPEQIDDLVRRSGTTVRVGEIVRECVTHLDNERFALRCPIVPSVPQDLPAPRREWLDRLASEAQRLWRIVRVGAEGSAIVATVDLTGAPDAALPGLVRTALASLRCTVAWASRPASTIVSGIDSSILDDSSLELPAAKGAYACATDLKTVMVSPRSAST